MRFHGDSEKVTEGVTRPRPSGHERQLERGCLPREIFTEGRDPSDLHSNLAKCPTDTSFLFAPQFSRFCIPIIQLQQETAYCDKPFGRSASRDAVAPGSNGAQFHTIGGG